MNSNRRLTKQERELALASRLLASLHIVFRSISPRDAPYPDVVVSTEDGRAIAIEVTEVHADDHLSHGSRLAAQEARIVRENPTASYALWHGVPAPLQAIAHRIESKVGKTYALDPGDQCWLLLAAGLPEPGKFSTFSVAAMVDVKDLEASTGALLAASNFDRAYLQFHLPAGLFEWTRSGGWGTIQEPRMFEDGNPILDMLRRL